MERAYLTCEGNAYIEPYYAGLIINVNKKVGACENPVWVTADYESSAMSWPQLSMSDVGLLLAATALVLVVAAGLNLLIRFSWRR